MDQQDTLVNQRVLGHSEGQAHTIADVNAGLIDDLIAPRLKQEREWILDELQRGIVDPLQAETLVGVSRPMIINTLVRFIRNHR